MLTVYTSEHQGRQRKYYRITHAGAKKIDEFKNEWREVMSIYKFIIKEEQND